VRRIPCQLRRRAHIKVAFSVSLTKIGPPDHCET
jgi:hypothetical protein